MSELQGLYQEIILDHCKRPRNFGPAAGPARSATGYNPLCGDRVEVHVECQGDRLARVTFEGVGCAISTASASLLTEAVAGHSEREARDLFAHVHAMLTGQGVPSAADEERLGKLMALAGVREYPMRVKCATLAWHTLIAALDQPATGGGERPAVSTE
jgi:nitrogen fixation NifU-like protein